MLAIAKAMTPIFALLEPKITSPNSDTLLYFIFIPYIADREYFSFALAAKIGDAKAFFIIRVKENLKVGKRVSLKITCSAEQTMPLCFKNLSDE
jgi:hypothetical protein